MTDTEAFDNNNSGIQDMEGEPILMGADLIGLYPNLDTIPVVKIYLFNGVFTAGTGSE